MKRLSLLIAVVLSLTVGVSVGSGSTSGIALVAAGQPSRGVSSVTPAFAQPTAAGDLLVAVAASRGTAGPIVSSDPSWIRATRFIFYKPDASAGESPPTFSSAGANTIDADLSEFSGADLTSPLDKVGIDSVQELHMVAGGPDSSSSDLAVVAVRAAAAKNDPTTTASFADSWSPVGTAGVLGGTGGIRGTVWMNGSYEVLAGSGGSSPDGDVVTVMLPKNQLGAAIGAIATFKPAS